MTEITTSSTLPSHSDASVASKPRTPRVSVEVSQVDHLIFVKLAGRPGREEIVKMLDELNMLTATDSSLRVLIDETDLNPIFAGPGDIGRFVGAWRMATALRSTRMAVFVSNLAMYGLNRMFEGLADAEDVMGVFRDRAEAMAWLATSRPRP